MAKSEDAIIAADQRLNKVIGYDANNIRRYYDALINFGTIEVGWREACGKTDNTQKVYREWCNIIKLLRKDGLQISEQRVQHGCAYATNAGGFWNSIIFTLTS